MPIPVHTAYAVPIGICFWARYKKYPLSPIATIAKINQITFAPVTDAIFMPMASPFQKGRQLRGTPNSSLFLFKPNCFVFSVFENDADFIERISDFVCQVPILCGSCVCTDFDNFVNQCVAAE